MAFTFGQANPTGRIGKEEERKSTDMIVLQIGLIKDVMFTIHKTKCKDIQREGRATMASAGGRYRNTKIALESIIDEEMCQLGYGEGYGWDEVVKVHNCAKDESYKANVNEPAIYLATKEQF